MKHSFYCEYHKRVELTKEVGCKKWYDGFMCEDGFEEWAYKRYTPKVYHKQKAKA